MAITIRGYRIFLSWQDGLEEEQAIFFETVNDFSQSRSIPRKILFIPIDWKKIPGGFGRAQSRINLKLEECDYLIVTLWKRMGTPPDGQCSEGYDSGTEEEYEKAKICLKSGELPMQDILVCTKEIPSETQQDDQLKKLIDFKEKVKSEGLIKPYKDISQFKKIITEHLDAWMLDIERVQQVISPKRSVLDITTDPSSKSINNK